MYVCKRIVLNSKHLQKKQNAECVSKYVLTNQQKPISWTYFGLAARAPAPAHCKKAIIIICTFKFKYTYVVLAECMKQQLRKFHVCAHVCFHWNSKWSIIFSRFFSLSLPLGLPNIKYVFIDCCWSKQRRSNNNWIELKAKRIHIE